MPLPVVVTRFYDSAVPAVLVAARTGIVTERVEAPRRAARLRVRVARRQIPLKVGDRRGKPRARMAENAGRLPRVARTQMAGGQGGTVGQTEAMGRPVKTSRPGTRVIGGDGARRTLFGAGT